MEKIKINNNFGSLLMPVVLIGANVGGKANFFTCGWFTRINMKPNIWVFGCSKERHTLKGIKENKSFSINFPGIDLIDKTDYCGIISGKNENKSNLFKIFYGDLKTAPMIEECPLNFEFKLIEIKELPAGDMVLGEVEAIFSDNDKIDITKINPFVLTMPDANYRGISSIVAKAWDTGKKIK
jgi:flavin reductase (DIM6/NTAB) family NADH-FMN oxidoreductase RutF